MKKVSRIHSNFALGMFAKGFEKPIYELGLNTRFEVIQKKALLHIACIVRKLLFVVMQGRNPLSPLAIW